MVLSHKIKTRETHMFSNEDDVIYSHFWYWSTYKYFLTTKNDDGVKSCRICSPLFGSPISHGVLLKNYTRVIHHGKMGCDIFE
jgi:hypothetical protein